MKNAEWCIANDYNFEYIRAQIYSYPFQAGAPKEWIIRYFEPYKNPVLLGYTTGYDYKTSTDSQIIMKWLWEKHNDRKSQSETNSLSRYNC